MLENAVDGTLTISKRITQLVSLFLASRAQGGSQKNSLKPPKDMYLPLELYGLVLSGIENLMG